MRIKIFIGLIALLALVMIFFRSAKEYVEVVKDSPEKRTEENESTKPKKIYEKPEPRFVLSPKPESAETTLQKEPENEDKQVSSVVSKVSTESQRLFNVIFNNEVDYEVRYKEVQRLSRDLNVAEVNVLIDELREIETLPEDSLKEFSVGNEVLTKLLEQYENPKELGAYIEDVVNNDQATEIWRNYSLQHYHLYAERLKQENQKSEELKRIKQTYMNAMQKQGTNLPGTALLGLNEMTKIDDSFSKKELRMMSYKTLYGNAIPSVKISAYQILAEMKDPSLMKLDFKTTQKLMGVKEGETVAMISVINAYSRIGGDQQKKELRRLYARTSNQIVKSGLKSAIERM